MSQPIPIIDLFAGPGGLGEGFSRFPMGKKKKKFKIALSIEKDPHAHSTLTLRAFFRQFPEGEAPEDYYRYLRGEITRNELFVRHPKQAHAAMEEAQCRTLGEDPEITELIGKAVKNHDKWVLIGGPPCQAYSLVGRSRMLGLVQREDETEKQFAARKKALQKEFEKDHRHTLYKEYLKIIAQHRPAVFVMENVKGILSAKLGGEQIFPRILDDLKSPRKALGMRGERSLSYRIFSLVKKGKGKSGNEFDPADYLIRAEEFGIPQCRHRVILLGIREDLHVNEIPILKRGSSKTIDSVIDDLPSLTPGLSKERGMNSHDALISLKSQRWWPKFRNHPEHALLAKRMEVELGKALRTSKRGNQFIKTNILTPDHWYADPMLGGICNHETRSHIKSDIWRYFFCACYAVAKNSGSPTLKDFPRELLPDHRNVDEAIDGQKFGDRFRVQSKGRPATTVTSHISKDGHYFIHYKPSQYRSLTVREAARIQTFPDNYFFEGPRTQQYHQVGNAVPPYLAYQIATNLWEMAILTEKNPNSLASTC
jgi:DNA (cytosine-5)-methyltransferase 1